MADIAPLRPLRYAPELFAQVVSPPYDVIDAELRARLGTRHEANVVHIDLPEGEGDEKYARAREIFERWQSDGTLTRDETPSFWRYEQTFDPPGGGARAVRKGFFALVRAVPYEASVVLPHEKTLTGPKLDRIALSRATRATLSPQFMLYSDPDRKLDAELDAGEPFAEFDTDDGVHHRITRVVDAAAIDRIRGFLGNGQLLIADGHHRYETAVGLAQEIDQEARASGKAPSSTGEHRYTFALLANGDDPNLVVFATHRLVHSLATFDYDAMLARAAAAFDVTELSADADACLQQLGEAGAKRPAVCAVGPGGRAALMVLKEGLDLSKHRVLSQRPPVVQKTAVAVLHDGILEDILGITKEAQAAKTNLKYIQDARKGVEAVQSGGGQVLFLMNPTPVATIREVAEAGQVMPQKSTFFYPKVPTGLLFHTLSPKREVG